MAQLRSVEAGMLVSVERLRVGAAGEGGASGPDRVACEEPLEIQVGAAPVAVVMRTPGADRELALGFLVGEGLIAAPDQVASVRHCRETPGPESAGNVIRVLPAAGVAIDLARLQRNLYASSSCGICGKATLENALRHAPPLTDPARFAPEFFADLPQQLRRHQPGFDRSGGLHAAGLFAPDGSLRVVYEDVGRHNAVDKTVGWALQAGLLPLHGHVLMVSGRVSYEIVQKALAARIPAIAAVSAPTSLAVDLARAGGVLLVAFLRDGRFSAYGNTQRLRI